MSISKIKETVRYILWAKSSGRCEFDGCNEPLYEDDLTHTEMNFADVAHIIGDSPQGPRGGKKLSLDAAYCNNVDNLMLMCKKHHRMIDHITKTYSDEVLRQMKRDHESRIFRQTAIKADKTSNMLIYRGIVGTFKPSIDYQDALIAMFPDYYPADYHAIELSMLGESTGDHEEQHWEKEKKNLLNEFAKKVNPYLEDPRIRNHFSVFGFAPIPLLVLLGTLIPDIYPAQAYQLHKSPPTWEWQPAPKGFDYIIFQPKTITKNIALNLSLSAEITDDRIHEALKSSDISIWKISTTDSEFPKNDHLRSKEQLSLFDTKFRKLLDEIKATHGQNNVLHIFPAVPVAIAFEMGRVRQPKADSPMIIYDQNNLKGGFYPAVEIGEKHRL